MPPLPDGTMIVYTHALWMGLAGAASAGVAIGVLAVGWWTEWRCTWCNLHQRDVTEIEEAGRARLTEGRGLTE